MAGTRQLSSLRDLVKDEEMAHVVLAQVVVRDGETAQWYKTAEGHIAVTCKTHRHGSPIDAILPTLLGNSKGIFGIPETGTEVAIGFDGGDFEGDAFVLAVYGGVIPSSMDDAKIIIVGDEVHVTTSDGGTSEPLVKRSEFLNHGHATAGTGTPSAPIAVTPSGSDITFPGTDSLRAT